MLIKQYYSIVYTNSKNWESTYGRFRNSGWWSKDSIDFFHKTIGTESPTNIMNTKETTDENIHKK